MSSMSTIFDFHDHHLQHVHGRRTRPLLPTGGALDDKSFLSIWHNVQGDVFMLLPKCAEGFVFFRISNATQFKIDLKSYRPSSSLDVIDCLKKFSTAKSQGIHAVLASSQIAFTRAGLNLLGYSDQIRDPHFDKGSMLGETGILGDRGPWYSPFQEANLHGVFSIAGSGPEECEKATENIKKIFEKSIVTNDDLMTLKGRVRPGANRGREHFGYKDGISQPALRGLVSPHKGQLQSDPGVIIMGYKGDPVYDNPSLPQRPSWTKNGSLMVFRQLEQDVLGFEKYLKDNGPDSELFGAKIVGRWKSGTPLAKCPYRDDLTVAAGKDAVNDFDYSVPGYSDPTDVYCPFTAHTRKTAPRNLDPYLPRKTLESALVVRGGIPYGPELTSSELSSGETEEDRGLLFICYQFSLENGFIRQTKAFAGNDYFPVTSFTPTVHGQDPIIGSPSAVATAAGVNQRFFVTSRGGEYFFVPSVSFIRLLAGDKLTPPHELDIVFLQDVTGSQGPYIATVRDEIGQICERIHDSPKLHEKQLDVRFGLVAFRDYAPMDSTMLTKNYGFTSDPKVIEDHLSKLDARGGGDGPEAQTAALAQALNMNWRKDAMKIVILITDAPPHAIGEDTDYFTQFTPDNQDPLVLVDKLAERDITLIVIACEPTLSTSYSYANDFYHALAQRADGRFLPLLQADHLDDYIIAYALEHVDIEALVCEFGDEVNALYDELENLHIVVNNLHDKLANSDIKVNKLDIDDVYVVTEQNLKNREAWLKAKNLAEGRANVRKVTRSKIDPKYQQPGANYFQHQQAPPDRTTAEKVASKATDGN